MQALNYTPNKKNLTILFVAAFLLRIIVFFSFVHKNEYYKQPDSNDYHCSALSLGLGRGMRRLDNNRPTFWRTPGYPLFLSVFYKLFGIKSLKFSDNWPAQTAAIIFQIILGSLIPILLFFLALLLTKSLSIAWLTAWISAIHLAFVLSDLYILTESLSILFLIPFFIYFFKSFYLPGEKKPPHTKLTNNWLKNIILAAILLGAFAWVRPMGQFVAIISAIMILILDSVSWGIKFKKISIFLIIFFLIISPWYARNYNTTGKLFFCPMLGLYLNTFNAPKIIRATEGLTLRQSINKLYHKAHIQALQENKIAKASGKELATELVHKKIAIPVILKHPFLFVKDWIKEVLKTTFDLYSYQIIDMHKGTYYYDDLEEFLTVKWAACIYKQKVPIFTRILVYAELLFELLKWLGLILGAFLFLFFPLIKRFRVPDTIKQNGLLWLKISPMIGAFVFMTGGFGYARLRLPVEGLMIILALTFWQYIITQAPKNPSPNSNHK
ncbi:phospholipid carrier-dependent glycosyltransferase [Candidatus Dependentiae bacterium]